MWDQDDPTPAGAAACELFLATTRTHFQGELGVRLRSDVEGPVAAQLGCFEGHLGVAKCVEGGMKTAHLSVRSHATDACSCYS